LVKAKAPNKKRTPKTRTGSSPNDPVKQYALDVTSGKEIAGPFVRLAGERHLRDLVEGPKRGLKWDLGAANRVFEFFREILCLSGGRPFDPHPSQLFILGSLFGWMGPDGYRRFRVGYIEEGKGNGKSPLAAGIGLYMLTADDEDRAEVYAAAVKKEQAEVLFRDAVSMVNNSIALDSRVKRSGGAGREYNLAIPETESFFRPTSSESQGRGVSGPRPHCALLDEIHEHSTDAMVEFMRAGIGKARDQGLMLMTTNSGVTDPTSVCYGYHGYAERILQQTDSNDSFFAYVCSLDPGDSWADPKVWKKANPLLGFSISVKYLEEQVREAKGMPSKQSKVRRLHFCEWMESADPLFEPEVWKANGAPADPVKLKNKPCFGGLDLSGKNALTALVLDFPEENPERELGLRADPDFKAKAEELAEVMAIDADRAMEMAIAAQRDKAILSFFWTPKNNIRERENQDRAPYQQWVDEGFIVATPGMTIDYSFVAVKIKQLTQEYDIKAIAFDKWRIDDLRRELNQINADVILVEHDQGFKDMDPAIEALEDDVLEGRLRHGNNPVLDWCVKNAKVEKNAGALRMLSKRKSTGRIDGVIALAMAEGLSVSYVPEPQGTYEVTLI
jgi:phage terminase large subunit-like protein